MDHLPNEKRQQLREITRIIVEGVDPEAVILFGSHATGRWVEDRFTQGGITYEYVSDYDILVITRAGDKRRDYEVQDIIENRCRYKTPVNIIVNDIEYVNKQLREGQYFFSEIEQEGILLYDAGREQLAERKPLKASEAKTQAERNFTQWYSSATDFLEVTRFCLDRGKYKTGAFELHQATERLYHTILLVFTGYKPKTHNLDKLLRYTKRFSVELAGVFPQSSDGEKHLFSLLLRAYIDARYSDGYRIEREELQELLSRVLKLRAITEKICSEKIASFDGL